ncbi:MAG: transcription-repair coupling factor, partial [Deltaproteobacteria bacterium]|nr:transcription-repair coupling factor [Deltaproteobacteria bacterium]
RAAVEVHARLGRRVVWVAPDVKSARQAFADIVHLDALERGEEPREDVLDRPESEQRVLYLPPALHSPMSDVIPDRGRQQARMTVLFRLALDFPWAYLVIPARSLGTRIPPLDTITESSDMLRTGMQVEREPLVALLVRSGYHRLPVVEAPGTFAVRGEILDVYPPGLPAPVRIELLWDQVERMRLFDPVTQRTTETLDEVFLHPALEVPADAQSREAAAERVLELCDSQDVPTRRARAIAEEIKSPRTMFGMRRFFPAFHEKMPSLLEVLEDAALFLENPDEVKSTASRARRALEADFSTLRRSGEPAYPPDAFSLDPGQLERAIESSAALHVLAPGTARDDARHAETVDLDAEDHKPLSLSVRSGDGTARVGSLKPLAAQLARWIEQGERVTVTAGTQGGVERLADLLKGYRLEPSSEAGSPLFVSRGPLTRGYRMRDRAEVIISEQEIFGPRIRRRRVRRAPAKAADDLRTLEPGDHVVHKVHGVGRFEGLVHRQHDSLMLELIKILYRDGDVLYVPVYNLDQVQKFLGGTPSRLDKLGGESFAKVKEKTNRAVADMADRLLGLYATRRAVPGRAVHPRDRDYREFEALFPYEETADQSRAIEEVMEDLEHETPMDRLVCGDVGFGKTEVAMRAAYRVAMAGRQVAVLVPTTILAQQHMSTFRQRLAGTPLMVEGLSRFQTAQDRRQVIGGLKTGNVDIVIGTHRLLSKDVHFADLGLLIIDEEHRFGVAQKERIKFLSPGTDVLHMTATPIPRTLQMSIGDIIDLSIISTAPEERLAVATHVVRRSDTVLREAIVRELSRGGQVFFVHNRVQSIDKIAERLAHLVPEARMAVAHGQMAEGPLEKIMLQFVSGRLDVLVCTSIIESGLDIPNTNTVLIDDAHTFGLAQLYQIRGRVGRSSEQAHAYLIVPPAGKMTKEAAERIDTLVRFTNLGSGFHVATMDMEIRGAGDLLGAEQSGHVRAVGFDLYCEMLRQAVERLRGQEPAGEPEPELSFDVPGYIPDTFVDDPGLRLSLYKKMASATSEAQVQETIMEIRDRFGPLPAEVTTLGKIMEIKVMVRRLRAHGLEASSRLTRVHLSPSSPVEPARLLALVEASDGRTRLSPEMKIVHRHEDGPVDTLEGARTFLASIIDMTDAAGM